VPYPFQNNIHRLPPEARAECAAGLVQAALGRRDEPFRDFDDFIGRTFGPGIARHFMRPYNTKVWGFDPRKLSAGWIAERVAVPDVARVVRNLALGRDDCAWGPNNRFRFPARGGTGAIWRALAARLPAERLHLGCALGALDLEARRCTFSNGERVRFGALLSTMPLDQLAALTGREELRGPAARLVHSSAHIVGVGLRGAPPPELAPKCWMYFPGDECPFYRVTHFSLYSPANVPDITSQWSLMCEVAESAEKPVDGGSVVAEVARGLAAAGLIADSEQIIHTWHRRVEYAYPTPTPGRDPALDAIQQQLTCHGVLSRGRFGSWRYEIGNMDHAFMQGVQAAERLLTGAAEPLFSGKP
jgi:protoporphyrinogen oxidase